MFIKKIKDSKTFSFKFIKFVENHKNMNEGENHLFQEACAITACIPHVIFRLKQERELAKCEQYKELLGYMIKADFVALELSTTIKIFLSAQYNYEKRLTLKNVIITYVEGFNLLFGRIKYSKNKDKIFMNNRINSFWKTKIYNYQKQFPNLQLTYQHITEKIEKNIDPIIKKISDKDSRNLFVHYNDDITEYYTAISNLNTETTFNEISPLFEILMQLMNYLNDIQATFKRNNLTY